MKEDQIFKIQLYSKLYISTDEYLKPKIKPGNNMPKTEITIVVISERRKYVYFFIISFIIYFCFPNIFRGIYAILNYFKNL